MKKAGMITGLEVVAAYAVMTDNRAKSR